MEGPFPKDRFKRARMLRRSTFPLFGPVFCALVLAVGVLLARPFVEMGFNDDWSYIWSARVFAQTGHIAYNGWGAMMLGWQLPLGALFIKLFGFSFTAVRASVFLLSLGTAALLHRTIVRCGISERNATFGTLLITFSPLFLPLAFSYMSDIPAFFCILLCFYACSRAMEAQTDRTVLAWLAFAAVSNVLLGTVRQIAWLGALVVVPSVAWFLRRRRGVVGLGIGLWIASAAAIYACLQWFYAQPYTFQENLRAAARAPLRNDVHCFMVTIFCVLPLLIAFLWKFPFRRKPMAVVAMLLLPFAYFVCIYLKTNAPPNWLAPFSGDSFPAVGFNVPTTLMGTRPDVMRPATRIVFTVLTLVSVIACVSTAIRNSPQTLPAGPERTGTYPIQSQALGWLLGPYLLAYTALVTTREIMFDRYWLLPFFILTVVLLRLYHEHVAKGLPVISFIALAWMALFMIASDHDFFATLRARRLAATTLQQAGVPRTGMYAGVEYDAWTELEAKGHVKNDRVLHKTVAFFHFGSCHPFWTQSMPDIHAKYFMSYSPPSCGDSSPYAPVEYKTWLFPRIRYIYILRNSPLSYSKEEQALHDPT